MDLEPKPPLIAERRGCSTGTIILGCAGLLLLAMVVLCGAGIVGGLFGFRWLMKQADQFAAKFESQGYERRTGQVIEEAEPIDAPRVYTAQMVNIRSDVHADLAIMSQVAEIHGTVDGDIDFFGQVLTIKPGAVVRGNIRVETAQLIDVQGTVEGDVTGSYQVLNWPNRPSPPPIADPFGNPEGPIAPMPPVAEPAANPPR